MASRRNPLTRSLNYLRRGPRFNRGHSEENPRDRDWEDLYRHRWQHDRVVRSTHGVNCTGSCSWQVYVKDGIVTWETQATDYPSLGPDFPEYEPRGCPRGASYSWYLYNPARIKFPYVRAELWQLWQEALRSAPDPLAAWESIIEDPVKRRRYQAMRGKGGWVRVTWQAAADLIAAACLATARTFGPDRVVGFSPIPAMSPVSYAGGARFLSLFGGVVLSFYDWYADLPPASPQIWGEQTDVPESADWYNATYFIIWGTNLPMTRTPDAHFLTEARYRGTKVVAVSPDYAEYVKFADHWLAARPGTDGALALAMAHVILKEFYHRRPTPYFLDYARRFTDLPFLVTLAARDGQWVADRFLTAEDLGLGEALGAFKPVVWDGRREGPAVPLGTLGHRWDQSGRWRLELSNPDGSPIDPCLTLIDRSTETVLVSFPYFGHGQSQSLIRGVPARRVEAADGTVWTVTTVYDLLLAHLGVDRGLGGDYPHDEGDAKPYTPAWQAAITGVPAEDAIRVAREFADNAARTCGRSMIALGAGTNHWYHSDVIYRAIIALVLLTGSQGVNGGGWAHYVGQEKVRPLEGWSTVAFGLDWVRPARQMNGTSFFYFATEQFRYEEPPFQPLAVPWGGRFATLHPADANALAVRLGWLPFYPQWSVNPLDVVRQARAAGCTDDAEVVRWAKERLVSGLIPWAVEHPDDPVNYPRVLFVWRSNLLGSSGKGHEYFLKHLLGTSGHPLADPATSWQPTAVECAPHLPEGKLDLLVDIDFRMTASGLYADVVLPAATWYEKHDLSTTDMHPFIHPFNPAIAPMWEAKSDWDAFVTVAKAVSRLAAQYLPEAEDLVMTPLLHDTPGELAQPHGRVRDWREDPETAEPGRTMPALAVVRRDWAHLAERMTTLGPLVDEGIGAKGIRIPGGPAVAELVRRVGTATDPGVGEGRPRLDHPQAVAEAILTLSGPTNGHRAAEEWAALEATTGLSLRQAVRGREAEAPTFADLVVQPRLTLAAPVWSGLEAHDRRYSPFTANVELGIPWRTLTGRQHFYLDHEVLLDFGEGLPLYRPPLAQRPFAPGESEPTDGGALLVRYLTPHQKWAIHSTYFDNPRMLTLFRGGQTVWISHEDAERMGIRDNDWVEVYNRHGAIVARAVVSHRIPPGVAMMYHAQDRTVGVPQSPLTGDRGGTHNSVTHILPKTTHMVGGYAQLSYGFNYYGPTGHQRDVLAYIRPISQEVNFLAD
ncbi:MAG: nitrate reductase subunit alpha [Firmicutes bacterium]|nr:nitrate reductase subunit alpha [Alicyclobacillaceae bacterium]MCL6496743.1 nitrate reductase subunit alpha [Bacillota bacterium]